MKIDFHRQFRKKYKKLSKDEKVKFEERLGLFVSDPNHPLLNNHQLHGKFKIYRSINITGDLRAHYEEIDTGTILFITIGTHPELYG